LQVRLVEKRKGFGVAAGPETRTGSPNGPYS